jgi:hypothetical protein
MVEGLSGLPVGLIRAPEPAAFWQRPLAAESVSFLNPGIEAMPGP